LQLGF